MNLDILYQDEDLLVINKPAGVVVNRAKSVQGETVQDFFQKQISVQTRLIASLLPKNFDPQYGSPEEIFAERQGMVHRLDKDTSGALILAKNPGSLVNLLAQFWERQVQKKYLALVHGKFNVERDIISFPIARAHDDRQKFRVDISGREAKTEYRVLEFYPDLKDKKLRSKSYQGFSLLECLPKTGRTHQIRVHLAHIKHPLVGDLKYLGRKRRKLDTLWTKRHFLHASEITFTHPRSGETLTITAPLPSDLQTVLSMLE